MCQSPQATYSADLPCETVSKINLVDLAGRSGYVYTRIYMYMYIVVVQMLSRSTEIDCHLGLESRMHVRVGHQYCHP